MSSTKNRFNRKTIEKYYNSVGSKKSLESIHNKIEKESVANVELYAKNAEKRASEKAMQNELRKKRVERSEYFMNVRNKVTKLLKAIAEHYEIEINIKDNYQLHPIGEQFNQFMDKRKADGTLYKWGEEYTPITWDDWIKDNFPDLAEVQLIYDDIILTKRISQEDLLRLNDIYKRYVKK